jgi:hypothetical protein
MREDNAEREIPCAHGAHGNLQRRRLPRHARRVRNWAASRHSSRAARADATERVHCGAWRGRDRAHLGRRPGRRDRLPDSGSRARPGRLGTLDCAGDHRTERHGVHRSRCHARQSPSVPDSSVRLDGVWRVDSVRRRHGASRSCRRALRRRRNPFRRSDRAQLGRQCDERNGIHTAAPRAASRRVGCLDSARRSRRELDRLPRHDRRGRQAVPLPHPSLQRVCLLRVRALGSDAGAGRPSCRSVSVVHGGRSRRAGPWNLERSRSLGRTSRTTRTGSRSHAASGWAAFGATGKLF